MVVKSFRRATKSNFLLLASSSGRIFCRRRFVEDSEQYGGVLAKVPADWEGVRSL